MINNIRIGKKILNLTTPKLMGIINVTPDSFYALSRKNVVSELLSTCEKMIHEGADILDLGAFSTRPYAENISENEELQRIIPVIKAIRKEYPDIPLSCDTFRASVAKEALREGVEIINDISGWRFDEELYQLLSNYPCTYILMHSKGTFEMMHLENQYQFLLPEMNSYFSEKCELLRQIGRNDIIIDPGFGFSKTIDQNYEILEKINQLHLLNKPILVGISRKSMIYKKLLSSPEDSLNGTTVLNTKAILEKASFLRVHDIKEAKEIIQILC
jgi:dihydropteroate synthase